MKVAVVDLGTNTCRLFLARVEGGRVLQDARVTTVVRLGQGVDKCGRLHPDAVARTHACLSEYAPRVEAYDAERRLLIATSVLRDATDGRQFLRAVVTHDFHLPWRVLRGEEEGALAFRGGTSWLAGGPDGPGSPAAVPGAPGAGPGAPGARPAAPDPLVLVDIGGGSTEFAIGSAGEPPAFVRSLDVGVVRLTERFFHADPPPAAEVAALADHVAAAVEAGVPEDLRAATRGMVGVAGTYTTLVAEKLGMTEYDAALVQGHVLSLADVDAAVARYAGMTSAERGRLPGIQPGREDVILAGALIAREACRAFGLGAVSVSEADILEGAALALADGSLAAAT
jgi:exopolyphosphatase/guanosine-5'-triphosphate,3'-diphosphate pyrophosphatase